jgi:hypothetical protein
MSTSTRDGVSCNCNPPKCLGRCRFSGRKRANYNKRHVPQRGSKSRHPQATTSTVPVESESLNSIKSWIANEKYIDVPKILAVLEMVKSSRFSIMAVLHKAEEVANFDGTCPQI